MMMKRKINPPKSDFRANFQKFQMNRITQYHWGEIDGNCDEANELLPKAVHFYNYIQDSIWKSLFDIGPN